MIELAQNPIWGLVILMISLVVLGIVGAMSIFGANNSANLASGTSFISQFIPLIALGIGVGLVGGALKLGGKI